MKIRNSYKGPCVCDINLHDSRPRLPSPLEALFQTGVECILGLRRTRHRLLGPSMPLFVGRTTRHGGPAKSPPDQPEPKDLPP